MSIYSNVEASLFYLVFDKATFVLPKISKYFAQYPFECIIPHLSARFSFCLYRFVPIIADVESCAIEMAGILCVIGVADT